MAKGKMNGDRAGDGSGGTGGGIRHVIITHHWLLNEALPSVPGAGGGYRRGVEETVEGLVLEVVAREAVVAGMGTAAVDDGVGVRASRAGLGVGE